MPKLTRLLFVLFLAFAPILSFTPTAQAEPLQGLGVDVYTFDSSALPEKQAYTLCDGAWTFVPNIDHDWGGDVVAGCQADFVIIHYTGFLTSPKSGDVTFQSWADDGFSFSLDGQTIIDDWTLKGCSGSAAIVPLIAGQTYRFDAWWYEYGGGACNRLYWDAEGEGMNVVSSNAFNNQPIVSSNALSKPIGLNGVVDGTTVDLVWASVLEDTPIEHYSVMWTYGDAPGWTISSFETKVTILDLPEDTDVIFSVRSDNDSLSVYSDRSDSIVVHTGFKPVDTPVDPPVKPPVKPPVVILPVVEPEPPVVPTDLPVVKPELKPSIVDVDLAKIDPQSLSDKDVALLAADALQTFETAVEGSDEYVQALEQLMIVAQADDIVVSEELASVPVLGATIVGLTNAFNALGNFGADMSPKARHKAKQEVVAAVIVTQIATTAVGLTASAPSSIRRMK